MNCRKRSRVLVCAVVLLLSLGTCKRATQEAEDSDAEAREDRWVRVEDVDSAARAARQYEELRDHAPRTAGLPTVAWKQVGPQSVCGWWDPNCTQGRYTGNVRAIAVHPLNSSIVFLGSDSGGVFRSKNDGNTWQPVTDSNSSLFISSLAIDPVDPNVVYAGTSLNVLRTDDGGDTWKDLNSAIRPVYGVAVSPVDHRIVLAATSRGIERSADSGETWTVAFRGRASARSVAFVPNTSTAYAGVDDFETPIMKTTDGGLTWASASGTGTKAIPSNSYRFITLAISASDPKIIYAGTAYVAAFGGLFKTTDGGDTWTKLESAPNYCAAQCTWFPAVGVNPRDPNFVMVAGLTAQRSLDGGVTWTRVDRTASTGEQLYVDKHAIAFNRDGSNVYVGDDGGIHQGTNLRDPNGITWRNLNTNLNLSQFYPGFSLDPDDPNTIVAGAQDTGAVIITAGAARGLGMSQGDCTGVFVDPLDRDKIFFSCLASPGVRRYSRSAQRFVDVGGAPSAFPAGQLVVDQRTPSRMYFGGFAVYQSVNRGPFRIVSPGIGSVTAIAVAPQNSAILVVGTQGGNIHRTDNMTEGAATWTDISNGLPNVSPNPAPVTSIAVDPTNPAILYASFGRFRNSTRGDKGNVYRSSDGGRSPWTDITANLPDAPVHAIVQDPDQPDDLYVATETGVFGSRAGSPWTPIGTGLPRVRLSGAAIHRKARLLRVSSYGRGVWEIPLGAPSTLILSVSGAIQGLEAAVTIAADPSGGRSDDSGIRADVAVSGPIRLKSASGAGWTCDGATCRRRDLLIPGAKYPPISLSFEQVPGAAASGAAVSVTVSGGAATAAAVWRSSVQLPAPLSADQIVHAVTGRPGPIAPGELLLISGVSGQGKLLIGGIEVTPVCQANSRLIAAVPESVEDAADVAIEINSATLRLPLVSSAPAILNAGISADGRTVTVYGTGGGRSGLPQRLLINGAIVEDLEFAVEPDGIYRLRAAIESRAALKLIWLAGDNESPEYAVAEDAGEAQAPAIPVCAN